MSGGSARGTEWEKTRAQVLKRDNEVCAYCGRHATQVDHVVPRSKGGPDTMNNLVSACGPCNRDKSDRMDTRMNWFNKAWLKHL